MNVKEIIKDAFVFPSKDIKVLLIYIVLTIIAGALTFGGAIFYVIGLFNPESTLIAGFAFIAVMLIGWVTSGYLISVIKSGIDRDDKVPKFNWWENFMTGFDNFVVTIVYFLIPAFIVAVVGYATNIYGNLIVVVQGLFVQIMNVMMGVSTTVSIEPLAPAIANLVTSIAITATVAIIVFIIFAFLETMAEARLANTGSLSEALNVFEAARDIRRIGIGKVIIVMLIIVIIIAIINMILSIIPLLSILSIIISPYLIFFAQRAIGLLYSDIA
ncbi:MAG: DUF4013 domain-containing protein [Methanobrevibacter thaueri]|nr:DUF4013 domain-containing protein [Methanobrevibacter thaueri]